MTIPGLWDGDDVMWNALSPGERVVITAAILIGLICLVLLAFVWPQSLVAIGISGVVYAVACVTKWLIRP